MEALAAPGFQRYLLFKGGSGMKNSKHFVFSLILILLLSFGFWGCSKLNSAKGTVINVITGQPVVNAEVVATSSSDIESEQKYLRYTTKTDKNGNFQIRGLPGKRYRIQVNKPGFTQATTSVSIPEKSTRLIKDPLHLCRIPPKKGIYIFNDNFEEITISKPYKIFNTPKKCCGHKSLYYKAADLKDIPPMSGNYLIKYGDWSKIQKMYWLFRRTKKENSGEAENEGDFYTLGGYMSQFAETYCSFKIDQYYGTRAEFRRTSSDNRRNHFWGTLDRVFYDRDYKLSVFKLDNRLPRGIYLLGYGNRYHIKENMPSFLLNLQ